MDQTLVKHVEALIFCSKEPISSDDIAECLQEMFEAEVAIESVQQAVDELIKKFSDDQFSFTIEHSGGGFQFLTKPAYQTSIGTLLKQKSKKKLSTSSLETLAIIAYKQPITKTDVERIRGVSCDYAIQKLLEKELVEIRGKSNAIGRPMLYGTTERFMDYFGINSIDELPQPKDFKNKDNEIGEESDY